MELWGLLARPGSTAELNSYRNKLTHLTLWVLLLGGSWDLVSTYHWAYI